MNCPKCNRRLYKHNTTGICHVCNNAPKFLKEGRLEADKKHPRARRHDTTLVCKICGGRFRPHDYQHPKYTLWCDDCRFKGKVWDISSAVNWLGGRAWAKP